MSAIALPDLKKRIAEHPRFRGRVLPDEVEAAVSEETLREYYEPITEAIALEKADSFRYGNENPIWGYVDDKLADFRRRHPVGVIVCMVLGGNRASKTEWRAKRTIENMLEKPNYLVWACHETQESSRDAQQKKLYKYLPPEFRPESGRFKQGMQAKMNYTPWGGFTMDSFAMPSNVEGISECRFKFYGMNPRSLEGPEIDEGWLDEETELEWLEALMIRAVTRNGIVFLTFTAKHGFTPIVKAILNGARTIEETEAELLPIYDEKRNVVGHEKVPRLQENLNMVIPGGEDGERKLRGKALIVYFHTSDNVYGNPEAMTATLEGASRSTIKTLFYGVPTQSQVSQFPLFSDTVHVVSLNLFREIQKNGGTWFQYLDPCPGRNWFFIYVFVDPAHRKFVVVESPSHGHDWAYIPGEGMPEPWAIPGDPKDGMRGGGQKERGWGYRQYLMEMARLEAVLADGELLPERAADMATIHGWQKFAELGARYSATIPIRERWIDGRYGNTKKTDEENPTTTIIELSGFGIEFLAAPTPAGTILPSSKEDGSLRMINDLLSYDVKRADTEGGVNATNTPHLFVVETCPNVSYALQNWTGFDGQKGATKDPIDTLRMLALTKAEHVDMALFKPRVHSHFQRR